MGTAIVTGASGGIGLELARLLARDGHEVWLVARSAERLAELARELPRASILVADLSTRTGVEAVFAAVPACDILVNNAGFGDLGPFIASSAQKIDDMIAVNVRALTMLTHRYAPGMAERRNGRILNVASTAAFQPGPLMSVYFATKAYVLSFSEGLAEELRASGVTVTALCPGPTESGFAEAAAMRSSGLVKARRLPSSAEVAADGYRALLAGEVVHVTGLRNRVLAAGVRAVPRALARRVVMRLNSG